MLYSLLIPFTSYYIHSLLHQLLITFTPYLITFTPYLITFTPCYIHSLLHSLLITFTQNVPLWVILKGHKWPNGLKVIFPSWNIIFGIIVFTLGAVTRSSALCLLGVQFRSVLTAAQRCDCWVFDSDQFWPQLRVVLVGCSIQISSALLF